MNGIERRFRLAAGTLECCGRLLAATAGVPLRRPFLILRCARGRDVSGLFSEFAAVLGALDHYERWRPVYAGLRVDFGDQGLYYDPAHGDNWWEYHFERIELGTSAGATVENVDELQHDHFAYRLPRLFRRRGHELIDRHIRPVARIREKVDAFVRERFGGAHVVGVHYRGTDKFHDAPRVPYETVAAAVGEAAAPADARPWKIFVATDEQPFLDFMRARFPGRIECLDMRRSTDGSPIDIVLGDNFRKGEDALLDCLLLARSHRLVRTASNLSLCSMLFSPDLPTVSLNHER